MCFLYSFSARNSLPADVTEGCKKLLQNIFEVDPKKRYSVEEIMYDPWMNIEHEHNPLIPSVERKLNTEDQNLISKSDTVIFFFIK